MGTLGSIIAIIVCIFILNNFWSIIKGLGKLVEWIFVIGFGILGFVLSGGNLFVAFLAICFVYFMEGWLQMSIFIAIGRFFYNKITGNGSGGNSGRRYEDEEY